MHLLFQFFGWLGGKERHYAVLAVIVACMSYTGIANLNHQWSILGEFSNYPQEELVEWIKARTPASKHCKNDQIGNQVQVQIQRGGIGGPDPPPPLDPLRILGKVKFSL